MDNNGWNNGQNQYNQNQNPYEQNSYGLQSDQSDIPL